MHAVCIAVQQVADLLDAQACSSLGSVHNVLLLLAGSTSYRTTNLPIAALVLLLL
jgi:hypothetical protein